MRSVCSMSSLRLRRGLRHVCVEFSARFEFVLGIDGRSSDVLSLYGEMISLNGQYPGHAPRMPVAMDVPAGNRARFLHNSAELTGRLTFEPMPLAARAAHIDYLISTAGDTERAPYNAT